MTLMIKRPEIYCFASTL